MEQEVINPELELVEEATKPPKRCSDFDDECIDVEDCVHCWLGVKTTGVADGYCPFIHNSN